MPHQQYHLAQFNIAIMRTPLNAPLMADFVAQLQTINALADASPGFVWRLRDEGTTNATSIRAYENERILLNLSAWESVAALKNYVYRSQHAVVMRERRRWFEKSEQPNLVLWWIPARYIPSVEEAKERLECLQQRGSTPNAFSFSQLFSSPQAVNSKGVADAFSQ